MTKRKQATLFSLKSWKNVAADNIQKYQDILANIDESESEILKALVSLKRKNPSRDVILSAKIDVSLELLEKHPSPIVCEEARFLRKHWQLNKNNAFEVVVIDEEPPSKKHKTQPETEICEIKTGKTQTIKWKVQSMEQIQEKQCPNELFSMNTKENETKTMKKQTIDWKVQSIKQIQEKQLPNESFLKNAMESLPPVTMIQSKIWNPNEEFLTYTKESVSLAATKPTQTVSKSSSVSRVTYNSVMRQLCDAVKLFTQELGEQEVRFYLEKQ